MKMDGVLQDDNARVLMIGLEGANGVRFMINQVLFEEGIYSTNGRLQAGVA